MKDLKKPDIAHGMEHTKVFVDKDTRLKQVAADAAMFLQQKRRVWHRAMMPDVESHLEKKLSVVVADLSGNQAAQIGELKAQLAEMQKLLEERTKPRSGPVGGGRTSRYTSFLRDSSNGALPVGPLPIDARRMSIGGRIPPEQPARSASFDSSIRHFASSLPHTTSSGSLPHPFIPLVHPPLTPEKGGTDFDKDALHIQVNK